MTQNFFEYYFKKENSTLLEGGAYSHLFHPYEDNDLKFSDLKIMIKDILSGKQETFEKLDGLQASISYKNGKLIVARNKGQLKKFGEQAMSPDQVSTFFQTPEVGKIVSFAINDLQTAISKLSKKELNDFFDEGHKFLSLEIMYNSNVIQYQKQLIIPHMLISYDVEGNPISTDRKSADKLFELIEKTNQNVQDHFQLRKSNKVQLTDLKSYIEEFIKKIDSLEEKYDISDSDSIGDFRTKVAQGIIQNKVKEFKANIDANVMEKLSKRLGINDKSYNIKQIQQDIKSADLLKWIDYVLKEGLNKIQKEIIAPLRSIFIELSILVLKNVSNLLAGDKKEETQKVKSKLDIAVKELEKTGNIDKVRDDLELLNKYGVDSLEGTEGLVWEYKNGKTYKITGVFPFYNNILNYLKFRK
jgi:hypothetical protein